MISSNVAYLQESKTMDEKKKNFIQSYFSLIFRIVLMILQQGSNRHFASYQVDSKFFLTEPLYSKRASQFFKEKKMLRSKFSIDCPPSSMI